MSPPRICGRPSSPLEGFTGAITFIFNLVFRATSATIVSGAMAEPIKFSAYCIDLAVISLFIYPHRSPLDLGRWLAQPVGFP